MFVVVSTKIKRDFGIKMVLTLNISIKCKYKKEIDAIKKFIKVNINIMVNVNAI